MDRRLSANLGIQADRGEDEDGIQIVIPSIYSGDSVTVLLDIVTDRPGAIADVSLRYKDLVFLRELHLILPADVNILGISGPSIRNHTITLEDDLQGVEIEFTREMDGQFRIELNYERIMLDGGAAMHNFGRIKSSLPRPDMIVTHTNWDVYVPAGPRYGEPTTNMDIIAARVIASVKDASVELLRGTVANVISGEPLHIELPTQGLFYRFAKLYANQSEEDAYFTMRYVHRSAGFAGLWISLLATMAIWAGIILMSTTMSVRDPAGLQSLPQYVPWVLLTCGAVMTAVSLTLLGASVTPPSILSLTIVLALGGWQGWQRRQKVSTME